MERRNFDLVTPIQHGPNIGANIRLAPWRSRTNFGGGATACFSTLVHMRRVERVPIRRQRAQSETMLVDHRPSRQNIADSLYSVSTLTIVLNAADETNISFAAFPTQLWQPASRQWVAWHITRIPAPPCFSAVGCGENLYPQEQYLIHLVTFRPTAWRSVRDPTSETKRNRPYQMRTKTVPRVGRHSVVAQGCHRRAIVVVNHAKPAQMLEAIYFLEFETELAGQQKLQWHAKRQGELQHDRRPGWE